MANNDANDRKRPLQNCYEQSRMRGAAQRDLRHIKQDRRKLSEHATKQSARAVSNGEVLKGPGGMTMRQIHEQVKRSSALDHQSAKMKNKLTQKPNRWQRFVRYVWDKKR